jgi:hypothetical protein
MPISIKWPDSALLPFLSGLSTNGCARVISPPDNPAPAGAQAERAVCFKCQRLTVVKAALLLGRIAYLRCAECGNVWSIPERRTIDRAAPDEDPVA